MFLTLLVISFTLAIILDYCIKKKRFDMTANIPGPYYVPIIGNGILYTLKGKLEMLSIIRVTSTIFGPIARTWLFNHLIIFISKPELVEVILSSTKHIEKNFVYKFMAPLLGDGLFLSSGQKWITRRKTITPTFHFKILEQFIDEFERQSEILVKQMEKELDGKEFNVYTYISLATLDIVCETAMATKINAQTKSDGEYTQAVIQLLSAVMERLSNWLFYVKPLFKLLYFKYENRHRSAFIIAKKFTIRVVTERQRLFIENNIKNNAIDQDDIGTKKKLALLDLLLQSTVNGEPLSISDIREEVDTFMIAGQDTTSSAASFTLYLLSHHPDIQSRVFQEICDVLGSDKGRVATYRDLLNLKYLECVIKESLRMFPVIPIIARRVTEDTKAGEYMIPAGSSVCIPIIDMMKDPKLFPEPEIFKPERHLPENIPEKTNPYSFIPFSAGPRNCIGQKFAMLVIKSILSKILKNYEVLPLGPPPIPFMNVILQPSNGVHIGIKTRELNK